MASPHNEVATSWRKEKKAYFVWSKADHVRQCGSLLQDTLRKRFNVQTLVKPNAKLESVIDGVDKRIPDT
ncbi:hypothetical protein J6590_019415 [Homalodisca vitripennis]|nr:hypothetical protein J6590_019415 [Homalodisca vitripennis]